MFFRQLPHLRFSTGVYNLKSKFTHSYYPQFPEYIFRDRARLRHLSNIVEPEPKFSSVPSQEPPTVNNPADPKWIIDLNQCLKTMPVLTMLCYTGLDIVSMLSALSVYKALAIQVSPNFVIAVGISRILRRVRLPVDVAGAMLVKAIYPPLGRVNLAGALMKSASLVTTPTSPSSASDISDLQSKLTKTPEESRKKEGGRFRKMFENVLDKYGLALNVSMRMITGPGTVFSIYYLLESGVDVQSILAEYGFPMDVAGGVTSAAFSVVASAVLFPLCLVSLPTVVRLVKPYVPLKYRV